MIEGYIKLHRTLLDWEWATEPNTMLVFIHLLLMANFKDGNFQGHTVKRGALISSRSRLSLRTGLSERQVRTALSNLEKTGELSTKATSKFTMYIIENYDKYQNDGQEATSKRPASDQQTTSKRPANDQQTTTIEERKKGRREEGKNIEGGGNGKVSARGSRLPNDWQPSFNEMEFALENGFDEIGAKNEADKFRDYWTSCSGQRGCKLDWTKTWRNWIRNARGYQAGVGKRNNGSGSGLPQSGANEFDQYYRDVHGKPLV